MAVAAECTKLVAESEEYKHSLSTLLYMGQVGVKGSSEVQRAQVEGLAYDEFFTAVAEHIKTDPEFRDDLDVDTYYENKIINQQVCNALGTPMVKVIETGEKTSAIAAKIDPQMAVEQLRSQGDRMNAERVDEMPVGTTRIALSMEPKKELEVNLRYWEKKGYRKGIAYLQWYSKDSDNILRAGAHSVDFSDETTWRAIFAECNVTVPKDTSPNQWITYGIELAIDSLAARQLVLRLRESYYQRLAVPVKRLSINEFMVSRQHVLKTNFEVYHRALSKAVSTNRNNEIMQSFASTLLEEQLDIEPAVYQQLIRIANSRKFDHASARVINSLICYATVEQLRADLNLHMVGLSPEPSQLDSPHYSPDSQLAPEIWLQTLHRRQVSSIKTGVQAGRSYGGCSPINITKKSFDGTDKPDDGNPQDVYGGKAPDENETEDNEECEYVHDGCYCCGLNDDGTPRSYRQKVKARRDSKKTAHCLRIGCGAWLSEDGKDYDIGDIARKAQALKLVRTP